MRTSTKLVTVFLLAIAPVTGAGPARAWGGSGCLEGTTQGTGTTIRIVDACFTPTILHIRPGHVVTWVNSDPFVHNITANGWGHYGDLDPGVRFSATFERGGLYPFACTYHPGMSGVIVVGDGTGPGNGATVDLASIRQAVPVPEPQATERVTVHSGGWAAPAAAALVLGVLAGMGTRRRGAKTTGRG
jgi:plastocyanin